MTELTAEETKLTTGKVQTSNTGISSTIQINYLMISPVSGSLSTTSLRNFTTRAFSEVATGFGLCVDSVNLKVTELKRVLGQNYYARAITLALWSTNVDVSSNG